jgi:hypothetical protein
MDSTYSDSRPFISISEHCRYNSRGGIPWKEFPGFTGGDVENTSCHKCDTMNNKVAISETQPKDTEGINSHSIPLNTDAVSNQDYLSTKYGCGIAKSLGSITLVDLVPTVPDLYGSNSSTLNSTGASCLQEPRQTKIQRYQRYKKQTRQKTFFEHSLKEFLETERTYISDLIYLKDNCFANFNIDKRLKIIKADPTTQLYIERFIVSFFKILDLHESFIGIMLNAIYGKSVDIPFSKGLLSDNTFQSKYKDHEKKTVMSFFKQFIHNFCVRRKNVEVLDIKFTEPCKSNRDSMLAKDLKPSLDNLVEIFHASIIPHLTLVYVDYCTFYSTFIGYVKELSQLLGTSCFASFPKTGSNNRSLYDYLIRPIQRICQYSLLFKQLQKYQDFQSENTVKRINQILVDLGNCIQFIEWTKLTQERIDKTLLWRRCLKSSLLALYPICKGSVLRLSSLVRFDSYNETSICMALLFESTILIIRTKDPTFHPKLSQKMVSKSTDLQLSMFPILKVVKSIKLVKYLLFRSSDESTMNIYLHKKKDGSKVHSLEFMLRSDYTLWKSALLDDCNQELHIQKRLDSLISEDADQTFRTQQSYFQWINRHPSVHSLLLSSTLQSSKS